MADEDAELRAAAFAALTELVRTEGRVLSWNRIQEGFLHRETRCRWASKPVGIFKPEQMSAGALSIKTPIPKAGRTARYQDLAQPGDTFSYALQGLDPSNHHNRNLQWMFDRQLPLIYFYGLGPGTYEPLFPMLVSQFDPVRMRCEVTPASEFQFAPVEASSAADLPPIERRYAFATVKRRLHQDAFRLRVLEAYAHRCSVCGLPSDELLDAAHICPDADVLGEATVNNGLALCGLHHSVFDRHLLGIRPDLTIELAVSLLRAKDGPTLKHALQYFNNRKLRKAKAAGDRPAEQHLRWRYERFRLKAG